MKFAYSSITYSAISDAYIILHLLRQSIDKYRIEEWQSWHWNCRPP